MKNKVIAIDGPAGSGKGTITSIIAEKCNLINIDTGATYRALALQVLNNKIDISDELSIIELAKNLNIRFDINNQVYLDEKNVTNEIRSMEVTKVVSQISSIVEVRKIMVDIQRKMALGKDVIMEGRDITTVVFPNADYKFYLDASVEERARRRFEQNKEKNINTSYEEILENIKKRDYNDMHKEIGSLVIADDAIYIDSTNMTIDEVVNKIVNIIGSE